MEFRKIAAGSAEDAECRKRLSSMLDAYLEKWTGLTGLRYKYYIIRNMTTRWGVCNRRTLRLTFNLQLVFRQEEAVELVVLHELAHILHPNHGLDFKAFLTKYMPDWKNRAKLLK